MFDVFLGIVLLFFGNLLGEANAQIEELQDDVRLRGEDQDEKEAMTIPGVSLPYNMTLYDNVIVS